MKPVRPNGYVLIPLAFVTAFLLLGAFASWADRPVKRNSDEKVTLIQSLKGPDLFRSYCASCHGRGGKGDGPVAPALNSKVPDFTKIARRHGGVFPEKWVTELMRDLNQCWPMDRVRCQAGGLFSIRSKMIMIMGKSG